MLAGDAVGLALADALVAEPEADEVDADELVVAGAGVVFGASAALFLEHAAETSSVTAMLAIRGRRDE